MFRLPIQIGRSSRHAARTDIRLVVTSATAMFRIFRSSVLHPAALLSGVLMAAACTPMKTDVKSVKSPVDLQITAFSALPDWSRDRQGDALIALRKSCPALRAGPTSVIGQHSVRADDWAAICRAADKIAANDNTTARKFFERWFQPYLVTSDAGSMGLFTGYFEAELRGAKTRSATYNVPLHGLPRDLINIDLGHFDRKLKGHTVIGRVEKGRFYPYHRRGDIQKGAIDGTAPVIAWVDNSIDAFLLHVQGSGRVKLDDGEVLRVGYAGNNGHGYVSIGKALIKQGELAPGRAGWAAIRKWIERNPQKEAALLAQNPRYIFFRIITGDGPIGSQGVALTPRRSLAVDRKYIPLGFPLWLDTVWPGGGDPRPLRRLMIAQDTGSAIKGPVRGDFFWGYGNDALAEAGRMKSSGRYFLLLPKSTTPPVS